MAPEFPHLALFHHLDEKITGPTSFRGPIGKEIAGNVHSLEVAISPTIPSADLPYLTPEVEKELNSDVKLLHRCAKMITTGEAAAVAHLRHVKLSGARW